VPPYDLDAYAAAVSRVLSDEEERRRLAAAGPRWVHERFSIERHVDALVQLLSTTDVRR
jgi:glycosyltransferase involved in cell wall biosynthesis